jgi:hypothetical protein
MHKENVMPVQENEPDARPLREAEENLRIIRELMERSTKYSTFSGFSGVFAGLVAIAGCLVQHFVIRSLPGGSRTVAFLINWSAVIALAIGVDFLLTKRRAPLVGKTILSRLGKQMALASAPGLGMGALLTLWFLHNNMEQHIYPVWMLAYGVAVRAVGLFSQTEVSRLGWAFLGAGALALLLDALPWPAVPASHLGLWMIAISFGGFHIVYGIAVSRRDGW